MDLTRTLLRVGATRPHVLLVEVPGGTEARLAMERELRHRGWPSAASPADADVIVVAGPVEDPVAGIVDRLWQQVPRPRFRILALDARGVGRTLDEAAGRLAAGGETGDTGDAPQDHPPAGHDMDGHDMDGGREMDMPGGVPMADRGEDRDGLMLDQLHVPLGPLLPDWPAGLVVHTTLQGDVVQDARVEVLGTGGTSYWDDPWRRAAAGDPVTVGAATRRRVAAHLDSLARFLTVAGWADATLRSRWVRDDVLGGAPGRELVPRFRRTAQRLRRSRTLRWLTDGLGGVPSDAVALRARGDVTVRWTGWLAAVEQLLPDVDRADNLPLTDPPRDEPQALLDLLPGLLNGVELATARLIVASLDPDLAELPAGVSGG